MKVDVRLCLPRESETLSLIRRIVSDALATVGVAAACIDDIRLALSEACTNILDHAAVDDEYEVHLEVDGLQCAISVRDTGGGFDADMLTGVMPDAFSPRGRGVAIMQAVMDHVSFGSEPESGTIVRLVKDLIAQPGGPLARLGGADVAP